MKHLRQTFFLAVLLSIAGVQAAFSAGPCGNGVYYDWGNDYTTLFILKGGDGDGQMTSHPWTEDAQHYATLTTVVIQDGVTSILGKAFDQCPNLTTVTIAKTVTSIDAEAFSLCENLETVTFADADQSQLTTIQNNAFANCVKLSSISLPEGVQTIDAYAFVCCSDLASATIPSTVTTMGRDVFRDCTSLATVYCNASTPPTGNYAMFDNNASGRIIYVPIGSVGAYKAAAYWSNYANDFAENTSVGAVFVADGIKYKITKTAPKEVEVVANNYSGAITIPAQTNGFAVTGIGANAFQNCTGVTSVNIPSGVTTIGDHAFEMCRGLIPDLFLPEGLTTIGANAFCNCDYLISVFIPGTVTSIGNYAFYGCTSLSLATVWATTPPTLGGDAVFGYGVSPYVIPTIKVLADRLNTYQTNWSNYSSKIEAINDFPNDGITYRYTSVSEVKVFSAHGYTGTTIVIPATVDGCTVTAVNNSAFDGLTTLTSVTLPNTITKIESLAFNICSNLKELYINAITPPTLENTNAFLGCPEDLEIYVPNSSLAAYKAAENWSTYQNNIFAIPAVGVQFEQALPNDASIKLKYEITKDLPGERTVKVVSNGKNISSSGVDVPSTVGYGGNTYTVTRIEDYAFNGTGFDGYYLGGVTLPSTITSIGVHAFTNCGASFGMITLKGATPPALDGSGAFDGYPYLRILVPAVSVDTYKAAPYWSNYASAIEPSSELVVDGIKYSVNATDKTLSVVSNDYTGVVEVPETVGEYTVTGVSNRAFAWDEGWGRRNHPTAITLPKTLAHINHAVFYGNNDLQTVTFLGITPPTADNYAVPFSGFPTQSITFHVPAPGLTAYQSWVTSNSLNNVTVQSFVPYREAYWDATDKEVKYNDANASDYRVLDANTVNLENGYTYVVSGSVTNNNRLVVNGTASIILCDGASLDAQKGITVGEEKTLNIYAQSEGTDMGEMNAVGDFNYAGIGGGTNGGNGGNVTIYGGKVTAEGNNGAGIGGGYNGAGGNVTIYGGNVTARGGFAGAGIGGGANDAGGTVTIYGGDVTARGGSYGAGIGGGANDAGGTVTINGGNVTARGGYAGAGIGGGANGAGGTVTINGGKVEATCDGTNCANGFAIGMGLYGENNGTLTVAGGLTVYGASGPSYGYTIIASPYSNRGTLMFVVKSDTPLWEDLTLNENADNSTAIADAHGMRKNVTLTRTLMAGGWNTFCAPFNISSEQIAAVFGAGAQVKELDDSEFAEDTGILTLKFKDATTIYHGTPYLVKVGANVVNPVFIGVTVDGEWCEISTDYLYFIPVMMSPQWLSGGDKNVIIIKNGNTFTYPKTDGEILCFRGYFLLRQSGPKVNSFIFDLGDDETTSIQLVTTERPLEEDGDFYDLQGRKVEKPAKGLYIKNGKKVIVK